MDANSWHYFNVDHDLHQINCPAPCQAMHLRNQSQNGVPQNSVPSAPNSLPRQPESSTASDTDGAVRRGGMLMRSLSWLLLLCFDAATFMCFRPPPHPSIPWPLCPCILTQRIEKCPVETAAIRALQCKAKTIVHAMVAPWPLKLPRAENCQTGEAQEINEVNH